MAFALVLGFLWSSAPHGKARSEFTSGAPLTGQAIVIDGDTISIGETRIRLEGIDAPESAQTCRRKWAGSWPCGTAATHALAAMLADKPVTCEPRGLDKYGRTLAVCFVDGQDVNARMVREGHAWAFVRYSRSYVQEEALARAGGIGIWQAETQPAWEFRAHRWTAAEHEAPAGCAIKGNVTRNGRIYHMPWSPWYAQVRIDVDKGKRWFCTEAEAIAAGWRPVQAH